MPTAFLQYFSVRHLQPAAEVIWDGQKAINGKNRLDDLEAETVPELPYEEYHGGKQRHDSCGREHRLRFFHVCTSYFCFVARFFALKNDSTV